MDRNVWTYVVVWGWKQHGVLVTSAVPGARLTGIKAAPWWWCDLGKLIQPLCASISSPVSRDPLCLSGFESRYVESEYSLSHRTWSMTTVVVINGNRTGLRKLELEDGSGFKAAHGSSASGMDGWMLVLGLHC